MSHNGLYPHPMAFDMALTVPTFYMLHKGLRVDIKAKSALRDSYRDRWTNLQRSADLLAGKKVNVNSSKQMMEYLSASGIKMRRSKGKATANEDALRAIMAACEAKIYEVKTSETKEKYFRIYWWLKLVLQIKNLRKRESTYLGSGAKNARELVDGDGRIRCIANVGGAKTARFSHAQTPWGTGTNLATLPRELRSIIIPDDGKELAEFDLNRGESWVYAFLSQDPELIRIHTAGGDFHSETASAISTAFGDKHYTVEEIISLYKSGDNFGYKIRYLGKKTNHASAYRMGPFRGAEVVNSEADDTGITVTVGQMRKAQQLWRGKYSGMQGWWSRIEKQINTDRTMTTPYGRKCTFYGFINDEIFKEATAYVPQSTSVDYLNLGMLRVYNDLVCAGAFGLELLHQQHDSILVQYDVARRDEVMGEIISRIETPAHAIRIGGGQVQIPVEGAYGENWGKLVGWKRG